MTLEIDVLTLFPAMFDGPLGDSIPGRIQERGLAEIRVRDLRAWGLGKHRSVDDAPYGGGAGMVLRPEPVAAALDELRRPDSVAILMDPAGEVFRHARAADLADADALHRRLPALRGRGRPHPLARRPRALDRRLRPLRRGAAGARRHRRRPASAPRRDRRRLHGRGVVQRRHPRVPAVHAPADVPGHGRAGDPRPRATTARSGAGGRSRRWPAPASAVPTCWTIRRRRDGAD